MGVILRSRRRRRISQVIDSLDGAILRGVYREPLRGACPAILRFAQNDNRRAQSDSKRSESAQKDIAEHFFSNLLMLAGSRCSAAQILVGVKPVVALTGC